MNIVRNVIGEVRQDWRIIALVLGLLAVAGLLDAIGVDEAVLRFFFR